jgi:glycosyltransferase involved in cell wall biosynthesis/GT2 family glycosyltransferase/SAM-dependent methyltransferase
MKKFVRQDRCNVCESPNLQRLRQRSDGRWVLACSRCGMGVVEVRPEDLSTLYGDDYYFSEGSESGYSDYAFTSEHGTAWAAALIRALAPSGRVLDVGCADGHLLGKLLGSHECYGIEVNAAMAGRAKRGGVQVISRDVFDPQLPQRFAGFFDVISAVAVLEHVADLSSAVKALLAMLKPDGFCLFEVPLISESNSSDVWFHSSLEHIYYPTEKGLRFLFGEMLNLQLTGGEEIVKGYGSTYIGVFERPGGMAGPEFERLISVRPQHLSGQSEKTARLLLDVVHAAQTAPEQVGLLRSLRPVDINSPLIARLADLWSRDTAALQSLEERLTASENELQRSVGQCSSLDEQLQWHVGQIRSVEAELQRQVGEDRSLKETMAWQTDHSRSLEQELKRGKEAFEQQNLRALELANQNVLQQQHIADLEPVLEEARQRVSELGAALYRQCKEDDSIRENLHQQTAYSAELEVASAHAQEQISALWSKIGALELELATREKRIASMQRTRAWRAAELLVGAKRRALGLFRLAGILFNPAALGNNLSNLYLFLTASSKQRESWTKHFDPIFYRSNYADVAQSGIPVTLHYLLLGFREGRWPAFGSDAPDYLQRYPDVAELGINPLLHYIRFGSQEARRWIHDGSPSPMNAPLQPSLSTARVQHAHQGLVDNAWPADLPLVSVVIPCFNYGDYIEDALRSIERQTTSDLEVIVVEGGSTDGRTPGIIRSLEKRGKPNVRFVYRNERHLVGDNRNFGIAHARGRYVCCLDADDMLGPVYLEAAAFLLENYGFDIAYPSVQCFGDSTITWLVQEARFPEIADENRISTAAVFRKSAWAHAGGYRDWGIAESHVPEDWEFWVRLLGHGFRAKCIRTPLMFYRVHGKGLSKGSETRYAWHSTQIRAANPDLLASQGHGESPVLRPVEVRNSTLNLLRRSGGEEPKPGVLLALPYLLVGGAERLFFTLAKGVAGVGCMPVITTSIAVEAPLVGNSAPFESEFRFVYDLPTLFDNDQHQRDFFFYLLERRDVRALVLAGSEFVYHLLPEIRLRFPQIRVIDQLFNDRGHLANNRRYANLIDLTVVPSRTLADLLIQKHGEVSNRVAVIPHGIEIGAAGLPHDGPRAAASAFPPDFKGKFIVSFFGRFSPEKAPLHFVETAARLARQSDDYRFCMTGDGPERSDVLAEVDKNGLQDVMYAPGFVDNVKPLLEATDVVVLPSVLDGMPLIVLEAQALGKCVVASSIGSLPEVIEDGVSGFLCPPGMIAAFVQRIEALHSSSTLCSKISRAAQVSVQERFSAERMTALYLKALLLSTPLESTDTRNTTLSIGAKV